MANSFKLILPADRTERMHYIRRMFPQAKGRNLNEIWRGGRDQALRHLREIDPVAYSRNRNFINGAVTGLSPYIRHGCISLKEVADDIQYRFGKQGQRLIAELAYRDFWRQNWYRRGNAIFSDLELPKVALGENTMPLFISQGITGLPCMDGVIRDLTTDGYVHNHARLWFAAYVIHWLKVDWRVAADWFEIQLIDGDKASNHLSWQWVASTFSAKPYFFNKENLARFTGEKYCATCQVNCPFDDSYENLQKKIFTEPTKTSKKVYPVKMPEKGSFSQSTAVSVYIHDEMLSSSNPLTKLAMPKYFIFDEALYDEWPLKRIQFMADCLAEMSGVEVWLGDTREVLQTLGVGQVISQNTPALQVKALLAPFNPIWQEEEKFTNVDVSLKRLERFSRYWEKVLPDVLGVSIDNLN
jgi:deoxyribodipyrimidine photo-lyase